MTKKQMLEVGLDILENWVSDNIFEVSDDEINEVLKDIDKMEKELKIKMMPLRDESVENERLDMDPDFALMCLGI